MNQIIHCPECKYYFPPVCTFYPQLPMTSRQGYCYHAQVGKYEGGVPIIEGYLKGEDGVYRPSENNMKCPECGAEYNSKVIDSRPRDGGVYRRRKCLKCGYKFSTMETITKSERDFKIWK